MSKKGQSGLLEIVEGWTAVRSERQSAWQYLDKRLHCTHLMANESIENPDWVGNMNAKSIVYRHNCTISDEQLRSLFAVAWPEKGSDCDYSVILSRSLGHVCAYLEEALVGFVYVAWDGGRHAFLLDPTVRTDVRRQGIGSELVRRAANLARSKGVEWLHVDFEPHLDEFYHKCGFKETRAGLIRLND